MPAEDRRYYHVAEAVHDLIAQSVAVTRSCTFSALLPCARKPGRRVSPRCPCDGNDVENRRSAQRELP